VSVAQLAKLIIAAFRQFPEYRKQAANARTVVVSSGKYFGKYYQDIQRRVPSVAAIRRQLGWRPKVDLRTAIKLTLDYHLAHKDYQLD
jgi:nucleoside-diphosphate-sugar epimerase